MKMLSTLLLLIIVAITGLALLNWDALSLVTAVSVGLATFDAPLGLLMLGLTALLAVLLVAYVLSLQGSVLLETRRHTKEMQAQRELADKAEASRFTELRAFLEQQQSQAHAALLNRLDNMETRLTARAQESDNTTAAYVGHLEQKLVGRSEPMA
ncbi:LapA family protein [Acidovorax temperans]